MKARNREINIFNMSLLDILCGALGAFCFMMLSLLPYYRTPGEDIRISEEQKKLLESVQDIKDIAERLKNAKSIEDLSELVKELQEKILALENEIKQLQGQVNSLLAERDELKQQVQKLEEEKQKLAAENQRLAMENEQLFARNEQLTDENEKLEEQVKQLKERVGDLEMRKPHLVLATAANLNQDLGVYVLLDAVSKNNRRPPPFDPSTKHNPTFWSGEQAPFVSGHGVATWLVRDVQPKMAAKLYINLANDPPLRAETKVWCNVYGEDFTLDLPQVTLTPERYWVLAGTFTTDDSLALKFTEATAAERDAEWKALTGKEPPKAGDSSKPFPFSQTDAEEAARREEARKRAAGRDRTAPDSVDPATMNRVRAFAVAYTAAKTEAEKQQILDKTIREAVDDKERLLILSTARNLSGGGGQPPGNTEKK